MMPSMVKAAATGRLALRAATAKNVTPVLTAAFSTSSEPPPPTTSTTTPPPAEELKKSTEPSIEESKRGTVFPHGCWGSAEELKNVKKSTQPSIVEEIKKRTVES